MVTVPTVNIYNIKNPITRIKKEVEDTREKFIGNDFSDEEKVRMRYIKKELKQ